MVLAVAQRLRRREQFAATIHRGKRTGRGALVVHLHLMRESGNGEALPARAGFVVSKAVGNAVTRNKVRRRLRHLLRDRLPTLPLSAELVVRALPAAAQRTSAELGSDLDTALAAALRPGRLGGSSRSRTSR
jgi:ribonuclease P protein component